MYTCVQVLQFVFSQLLINELIHLTIRSHSKTLTLVLLTVWDLISKVVSLFSLFTRRRDVTLTKNYLLIVWTQSGRTEPLNSSAVRETWQQKRAACVCFPSYFPACFLSLMAFQKKTLSIGPAPTQSSLHLPSVLCSDTGTFHFPESFLGPHAKKKQDSHRCCFRSDKDINQPVPNSHLAQKPYANQPVLWWPVPGCSLWIKALAEGLSGRPTPCKPLRRPLWSPKACAR